jgi:hypothetical protein
VIDGCAQHVGAHDHTGAATRWGVIDGPMPAETEVANWDRAHTTRPPWRLPASE